jgi:hypothetical protein
MAVCVRLHRQHNVDFWKGLAQGYESRASGLAFGLQRPDGRISDLC